MLQRLLLICALSISSLNAFADAFDISLNNDTAQFKYFFDTANVAVGGADRGFGVFFNENDDVMGSFEFLVTGNVVGTNRAMQLGAGFKAYAGMLDIPGEEDTVAAIAIGVRLNYILPAKQPMAVYSEFHIAPNITSFADSEQVTDFTLGFEIEVAPSTKFYLGYRSLEVEMENNPREYELADGGHIGMRVSF